MSVTNSSRSRFNPASKGSLSAAVSASTQAGGAG